MGPFPFFRSRQPAAAGAAAAALRQLQAQQTLTTVAQFVEELPPHQRAVIRDQAQLLRDQLQEAGLAGVLALTLVSAEVGVQSLAFTVRQLDQDGSPQ